MTQEADTVLETNILEIENILSLFKNFRDPILLLNEGKFCGCNDAAVNIFGAQNQSHLLHVRPAALSPEFQLDGEKSSSKAVSLIAQALEKGSHRFEWDHQTLEGEVFPVEVSLAVVGSEERPMLLTQFHDITERKLSEMNLEAASLKATKLAQIADKANKAKSDFLAIMSHEIRTPMNGILGMTDLLLETPVADDQKSMLETLHSSGDSLLQVINEILDFSRIESGRFEMENESFDLYDTLESVWAIFEAQAEKTGLNYSLDIDAQTARFLVGDAGRLRQILNNLLSNSLKFTHEGSIRANVTVETDLGSETLLKFSVVDSGNGISPDRNAILFDPFTQADSSTSRESGRTGLGLSITKKLVELMGGNIQVDCTPGIGSSFHFTCQFKKQDNQNQSKSEAGLKAVSDRNQMLELKILLAEDNLTNQMVAKRILKKLGCHVDVVANGQEALDALAAEPYDVVLMDCMMPEMDGYTATKAIRNSERAALNHGIPIVAVTANAMIGDREKCLDAGMDDYVSKPIRGNLLAEALLKVKANLLPS